MIAPTLSKLRDRSRELVRNNPYAHKAIDSLVANAVGTGITLKLPQGRRYGTRGATSATLTEGLTFMAAGARCAHAVGIW